MRTCFLELSTGLPGDLNQFQITKFPELIVQQSFELALPAASGYAGPGQMCSIPSGNIFARRVSGGSGGGLSGTLDGNEPGRRNSIESGKALT